MRLLVVVEDDEVVAEPQVVAGRLLLGALVGKDQGLLDAVPAQLANLVVRKDGHDFSASSLKRGTGATASLERGGSPGTTLNCCSSAIGLIGMTWASKSSSVRSQKSMPWNVPRPSSEPGESGL